MNELIKNIIKPENGIETAICNDNEFIIGVNYGKPRPGHIEGQIIYHIEQVLDNINKYYKDDNERAELRLIAILHDSFKHKVDQTKPKTGENHHGQIAERFALNYCHNTKVLTIIQLHDEAYNAWQKGGRHGDWYGAKRRAEKLISNLKLLDSLDLYIKFYRCDNATGDKSYENFEWFVNLIK
jgi:hypothetical protein